ncbi:unnamed protein product [marine sediment metagenome]|uniref:Uncharacterized protein n=1 Tax=marine sediment metagenome TaxID=412755 RepID=X1SW09_9ZZZZ
MMTDYRKLYELMHLVDRAIDTCHYSRAEKLFRQLLTEAFESRDNKIIADVSIAFIGFRRHHAIETLKILKRIDPIQAQRKVLS